MTQLVREHGQLLGRALPGIHERHDVGQTRGMRDEAQTSAMRGERFRRHVDDDELPAFEIGFQPGELVRERGPVSHEAFRKRVERTNERRDQQRNRDDHTAMLESVAGSDHRSFIIHDMKRGHTAREHA